MRLIFTILLLWATLANAQKPLPAIINGHVKLDEGTYVLPVNFSIDLGSTNLTIEGVPGKTIITSYDGKQITDFRPIELDTNIPDSFPDGLYVVANHPYIAYGGGYAHLQLKYNTGGVPVYYCMGTVLRKENGIWSRHYTGYGFKTKGNITVKNVIFDNCQFYLFSPFGQTISDKFSLTNCTFKNVARVVSSITYAGINHSPDWYNALNYYSAFGALRYKVFEIKDCVFERIHTSIVWGCPPSENTMVSGNVIKDCSTMITAFNLFIKYYGNENYFNDKISQVITGNTFMNIRSSQNWQTMLIRTSGIAAVTGNNFIDCTQQLVFFYGENSTFSANTVKKINTSSETQAPVILVKSPSGLTSIHSNIVNAPYSIFVAMEGGSSCSMTGNTVTAKTVFSRVDNTNSTGYFRASGNTLQCGTVTNLSSKTGTSFRTVDVSGNTIVSAVYLNTGATAITNYIFENNRLQGCYFSPLATSFYNNNINLQ